MKAPVPSATRVNIIQLAGGKAIVRIDRGEELILDCIVWKLLTVLLLDLGVDEGKYIDWKPPEEIRRHLEKQSSRSVTQRSIKQSIYRLRNALAAAGYSRWLVQYKKERGYRFALLRRAPRRS